MPLAGRRKFVFSLPRQPVTLSLSKHLYRFFERRD